MIFCPPCSYFDRPVQKSEWRMDIRNEEIMSSVNIHGHPGHPGGNTFLAPQPLQGSSKIEQRPLPPAPCPPPGPTFRYSWYNSIFLCKHFLIPLFNIYSFFFSRIINIAEKFFFLDNYIHSVNCFLLQTKKN